MAWAANQLGQKAVIIMPKGSTQTRLNHILADHSGKSYEDVVRDTDRDYFMSADEAATYGLIDAVVSPKK